MDQLFSILASGIVAVISATGYVGILLLMALESACLPLPSEVIMPFAGYLVSVGSLSLLVAATAGAVGCSLGSTVAYFVAAWGGRPVVDKWGRYLLIASDDVDRATRFFERFGSQTVFVGRLLPVVRSFVAIPAGFARMNMWKFQIYTFIGSWIWCFALAWIGLKLGDKWQTDATFRSGFRTIEWLVVLLLVAAIGWWIYRHVKASRGHGGES